MVSFSCEVCNETLIKKKVKNHRCRNAAYTCLDCSKTFYGDEYNQHNQCISEAEKYEKSLYNPKKKKGNNNNNNNNNKNNTQNEVKSNGSTEKQKPVAETTKETKTQEEKPQKETTKDSSKKEQQQDSPSLSDLIESKPTSLHKVVKKLQEKQGKKKSKDILKNLTVEKLADGTIILKPISK